MVLLLWGVGAILGKGMEFKDKIMFHSLREVKYLQDFTTGV